MKSREKKKSKAHRRHIIISSDDWRVQLAAGLWIGLFIWLAISASREGPLHIWEFIGWGIIILSLLLIAVVCIIFAYGIFKITRKLQWQPWGVKGLWHVFCVLLLYVSLLFLFAGFLPLIGFDHIPLNPRNSVKIRNTSGQLIP